MTKDHSFFIPNLEYLIDPEALFEYLGTSRLFYWSDSLTGFESYLLINMKFYAYVNVICKILQVISPSTLMSKQIEGPFKL